MPAASCYAPAHHAGGEPRSDDEISSPHQQAANGRRPYLERAGRADVQLELRVRVIMLHMLPVCGAHRPLLEVEGARFGPGRTTRAPLTTRGVQVNHGEVEPDHSEVAKSTRTMHRIAVRATPFRSARKLA